MQSKKINSLTGMRFFAIMIIVISHLEFLKNLPNGQIYMQFFHNPEIGVDFFFVLSGFGLMLSDINRNGWNIGNTINIKNLFMFAYNHIKKIYPVYIATIFLCIPLYLYQALSSGKTIAVISELLALKLLCCLGVVQSFFGFSWLSHSFNGVCWFLSALCCIYFASPILINLLKRFCTSLNKTVFSLILCAICTPVFMYLFKYLQQITVFDDFTYGSPFIRVFYVVFGMLLAIFFKKLPDVKTSNFTELIVFSAYIAYFLCRKFVLFNLPYISIIYVIDIVFAGMAVLLLAYNQGFVSKLLSKPSMLYFGNISMYIFLIHYPVRMYSTTLLQPYLKDYTITGMTVLIILAVTWLVSHLLYKPAN
ncbi:MAG: acyltransferase [Candidatus Gastranaerophilales bacterium]|nr:acyltransferase [Candidatus Gastranaerophilales bacterium]